MRITQSRRQFLTTLSLAAVAPRREYEAEEGAVLRYALRLHEAHDQVRPEHDHR